MSFFDKMKAAIFRGGGRSVSVGSHTLSQGLGIDRGIPGVGYGITQEKSLVIDAVWACVRLISQTIGTLPCHLFRTGNNGFGEIDKEHKLYRILHDKPNKTQSAVRFWESATAHMAMRGNHYSLIRRDAKGDIIAIIPFPYQQLVTVEELENGNLQYTYSGDLDSVGGPKVYQQSEIFHLRGLTIDGKIGLSALKYGAMTMNSALAVAENTGKQFSNGLQASGLITPSNALTNEQVIQLHERIREHREKYKGEALVFPFNMTYSSLSMTNEDAQLIEVQGFGVEQICSRFGVPPFLIGHTTKVTSWGSGIEQMNLFFLQYGLRPYLGNIESEIQFNLLRPEERGSMYAKFNVEGLLRGDSKGRAEYLKTMVNGGLMTPNEGRAKEDLPPLDGGDTLLVQTSYVPIEMLSEVASRQNTIGEGNATENP